MGAFGKSCRIAHYGKRFPAIEDDELAKRFDYLMYTIEYADLKKIPASKPKNRVFNIAEKLTEKGSVERVKRQERLIKKVQSNEHWEEADIFDHEEVREAFRDLMKFLDSLDGAIFYTDFTDEVIKSVENVGDYSVNDMQSYRKKVNRYLLEHQDDLAIYKLRNNKPLTKDDVKHFEQILWEQLGSKDDYVREFGDEPLLKLVGNIVGLDPRAANDVFSEFLTNENLNPHQMDFVKLVIDYVVKNGSLDKRILTEHPFNKRGTVLQLFNEKLDVAKRIITVIDNINGRLTV